MKKADIVNNKQLSIQKKEVKRTGTIKKRGENDTGREMALAQT